MASVVVVVVVVLLLLVVVVVVAVVRPTRNYDTFMISSFVDVVCWG